MAHLPKLCLSRQIQLIYSYESNTVLNDSWYSTLNLSEIPFWAVNSSQAILTLGYLYAVYPMYILCEKLPFYVLKVK